MGGAVRGRFGSSTTLRWGVRFLLYLQRRLLAMSHGGNGSATADDARGVPPQQCPWLTPPKHRWPSGFDIKRGESTTWTSRCTELGQYYYEVTSSGGSTCTDRCVATEDIISEPLLSGARAAKKAKLSSPEKCYGAVRSSGADALAVTPVRGRIAALWSEPTTTMTTQRVNNNMGGPSGTA